MGRRRRSEREGDSEKAGGLEKGRAERDMKGRIRDAETPAGQREAERNGDSQTETDEGQGVIPKGPGPPGSQRGPRDADSQGPQQRGSGRETEAERPRR